MVSMELCNVAVSLSVSFLHSSCVPVGKCQLLQYTLYTICALLSVHLTWRMQQFVFTNVPSLVSLEIVFKIYETHSYIEVKERFTQCSSHQGMLQYTNFNTIWTHTFCLVIQYIWMCMSLFETRTSLFFKNTNSALTRRWVRQCGKHSNLKCQSPNTTSTGICWMFVKVMTILTRIGLQFI